MATDDEKSKLAKLLQGIEIPDVRLTERTSDLIKSFKERFQKEIDEEARTMQVEEIYDNPYKADKKLLEENEKKLKKLLAESKRVKKTSNEKLITNNDDPKRPWRTNSSKEKLLRINNELKHHHERGAQATAPLADGDMQTLLKDCEAETRNAPPVPPEVLKNTIDAARKNLPNFQYRKVDNSTATIILPEAHVTKKNDNDTPPLETIEPLQIDP